MIVAFQACQGGSVRPGTPRQGFHPLTLILGLRHIHHLRSCLGCGWGEGSGIAMWASQSNNGRGDTKLPSSYHHGRRATRRVFARNEHHRASRSNNGRGDTEPLPSCHQGRPATQRVFAHNDYRSVTLTLARGRPQEGMPDRPAHLVVEVSHRGD